MSTQLLIFKNNLPNLTVLKLFSQDLDAVKHKLRLKIKQAPMMFIGMQLVIDVSDFDREASLTLNIDELLDFLRGEGINPVALMSDKTTFREHAVQSGIGALPTLQSRTGENKPDNTKIEVEAAVPTVPVVSANAPSISTIPDSRLVDAPENISEEPRKTFDDVNTTSEKIMPSNQVIRHPVRSGQRLYARGDLTIIGTVSPGAEVIADGSIHVYGKLSGRAIAGAQGDENALIFCQHLDAELVSIAGNYKQLEDIAEVHRGERVQISLDNEKICFFSL